MARYRVEDQPEGVAIQVTEVAGRQRQLLEAFQECQSGHCTCPTDEYQKVAGMQLTAGADEVVLRLQAKPGTRFVTTEISSCLDHTIAKVEEQ
jgi:hypothetical protein